MVAFSVSKKNKIKYVCLINFDFHILNSFPVPKPDLSVSNPESPSRT